MVRMAASLSLTSWSGSGPWSGGSRTTCPSSTLDWLLSLCHIHQDHRQISGCRSPSSKSDADAHGRELGESSATTGVCVCNVCVFQSSFTHPGAGERCGWKDFGCAVKPSPKLRQTKVQQKAKWERKGSFRDRGREWTSLVSSASTWPKRKRLRRKQPKVCSTAASS